MVWVGSVRASKRRSLVLSSGLPKLSGANQIAALTVSEWRNEKKFSHSIDQTKLTAAAAVSFLHRTLRPKFGTNARPSVSCFQIEREREANGG